MNQKTWGQVDENLAGLFDPPDPSLDSASAANTAAGVSPLDVTPLRGKFPNLIAIVVEEPA